MSDTRQEHSASPKKPGVWGISWAITSSPAALPELCYTSIQVDSLSQGESDDASSRMLPV